MDMQKSATCLCLVLLLLHIRRSVCQYPVCTEFSSPIRIKTFGTAVGSINLPLTGRRYRSNQMCEWTIETKLADYGIRLDVISCNLQGRDIHGSCNNDYVDIFDYKRDSMIFFDRFCGTDVGKTYLTGSNKMTIRFHSDAVFQFNGFRALFQAVPLGPSKEQQEDDEKKNLNVTIAIPVAIFAVGMAAIFAIFMIRYFRRKKLVARPPQITGATSHRIPPGGDPSTTSGRGRDRVILNYLDPLSRSRQVGSGSAHESSRTMRSVTPPPAYDSLYIAAHDVEHNGFPISPPPYDLIVKQDVEPANV